MPQNPLFRKKAIDKIASPERIDIMMRVTSPVGWLALATIGVILAGVVSWSVAGSVSTRVTGDGILTRGQYFKVQANDNGRIEAMLVTDGESVDVGQVIATLTSENTEIAIESQCNIANAKSEAYAQLQASSGQDKLDWREQIETFNRDRRRYQEKIDELQPQLKGDLRPTKTVQAEIDSYQERIQTVDTRIDSLQRNIRSTDDRLFQLRQERDIARERCDKQRRSQSSTMTVVSYRAGKVISTPLDTGANVSRGTPVAWIQERRGALEAIFFVEPSDGKSIDAGMTVEIEFPKQYKREEFGFIYGVVEEVGEKAVEIDQYEALLGAMAANERIRKPGTEYFVKARLLDDDSTPTGFKWSTSKGPDGSLEGNEPILAHVITKRKRPIEYVIPVMKNAVGL